MVDGNVSAGQKCTEADAGAGKDVIVASMHALGWPVSSPQDAPAAIEAAVSAAEAAIAAVTAAASLQGVDTACANGGSKAAGDKSSWPAGTVKIPANCVEASAAQAQRSARAAMYSEAPWTLPPIAEDCPLGDQTAQAFMDASSNPSAPSVLSPPGTMPGTINAEALGMDMMGGNVQVDAWIHGWAAQVSELLGYFSREIARLVERMDQADQRLSTVTEAKLVDASRSTTNAQCQELAATFTEALKMEREARMHETAQLRAVLSAGPSHVPNGSSSGSSSATRVAESLAKVASAECDRFTKIAGNEWKSFSEGAATLRTRLSSELTEQHNSAVQELREQHAAAMRLLASEHEVRTSEARDLQVRLHREVAEIASEVAEDILEQQEREKQCAELRIVLQQAAQDGVILPSSHSTQGSATGEARRRVLSVSNRSHRCTVAQLEPRRQTEDAVAPRPANISERAAEPLVATQTTAVDNIVKGFSAEGYPNGCTEPTSVPDSYLLYTEASSTTSASTNIPVASTGGLPSSVPAANHVSSQMDHLMTQACHSHAATGSTSLALRAEAAVSLRGDHQGSASQLLAGTGAYIAVSDLMISGTQQDPLIDRFGSYCMIAPERRSGGSTRGISPERRSPTRGSRLLPPPSMVFPPPSQVPSSGPSVL
jgi:hypothetical protein